ncbi:MAG: S41 family peptidase [Elusimicrobiota bacterium]|jgi:carboxyl-terminal processing protease|nr:S41 family peptidase [Elusimicrobiota bacterium]
MKKKVNKYIVFAIGAFFLGSLFPTAYSGVDTGLEQLKVLVDVMQRVQENYVEETQPSGLITGAMQGMVGTLDEFSEYITPEEMRRMREDTRGEFGGVGLKLVMPSRGVLLVTTPMPDTPSYKAGIEPGDIILKIDGKAVADMQHSEAVDLLRGAVGKSVKVEIERKDAKTGKTINKTFSLKRENIVPQVVYSKMLEDKIGYVYVTDFSGHTMADFEKALETLKKQGMQALIVDLRFNPGGLLSSAVEMAKLFIGDNQMIVYTKGRKEEFYKEYRSGAKAKYADLPVAILVNEGSASGSEIVAGAFQDYQRGVLLGSLTFGKGSVQQVIGLPNEGGLRITVAKYYTPQGRSIHKNFKAQNPNSTGGIVPDISVPFDVQNARKATFYTTNLIYSPSKKTIVPDGAPVEDPVLNRALEILKARGVLASLKPQPQEAR